MCLRGVESQDTERDSRGTPNCKSTLTHLLLIFLSVRLEMHRRMRSGWIKGLLLLLSMATVLLYLGSIRREVHIHSERLQRAHQNDSIRGQGVLKRMEKMEANINRLRESHGWTWLLISVFKNKTKFVFLM